MRRLASALLAGAGACMLLCAASRNGATFAFGISPAAAAAADLPCRTVLDAKGVGVSRQGSAGRVVTATSGRCTQRVDSASRSAPAAGKPLRPGQGDAIPGLSAEPAPRAVGPEHGPLRFAAENPERVGAALLTGSAMLWVLHSGFWTSLLMLGLPLWRHVDLLPIVAAAHDDEADAAILPPTPEESAVAQMLEEGGAHAPAAGPDT
jgi:hypothetical protein